jgi:hypothetical protein
MWINVTRTQSLSDPNFDQKKKKLKGFKISSLVQIKQQYLTILCFCFLYYRGLSSQYVNIFPRGLPEGILSWALFSGPLFAAFISYFSLLVNWALSTRSSPSPLPWRFSCILILFCSVPLLPHPLWELEAPLGGLQVSISCWPGLDSTVLPQNCRSDPAFPACPPTHLSHTSHRLQYPDHQDITWSPLWHFLSWFVHKTYVVAAVPVFRDL